MKKMTRKCKRPFACTMLALIISALPCGTTAMAQPQQSENFRITKSVIDAGGAPSTSADFRLTSAYGQPTPIGNQSSENFVLFAGFLSPEFAVSPLSPIQQLVIRRVGYTANMRMDWERIVDASGYKIYRSTNPLFTPAPTDSIGYTTDTTYTDVNATLLPGGKYFYIVESYRGLPPLLSTAPAPRFTGTMELREATAPGVGIAPVSKPVSKQTEVIKKKN